MTQLFDESILEFIRREKAVTTAAVGYRFGWDTREARKHLTRLRNAGLIVSQRESHEYAAMNGWRIAPPTGGGS